jgi:hypothetical protein
LAYLLAGTGEDEFKNMIIDNVIPSDPPTELFYCYFGTIPPERFEADD